MAGNNFPAMVSEGVQVARGYPPDLQPYLYGPIISSRVLAGSLGATLSRWLGAMPNRNQLAAGLQPSAVPFTTTASSQTSTLVQVGQFGNFISTGFGIFVTTTSAPAAASAYDFQVQIRLGRTDFAMFQNMTGVHVCTLMGIIGSGTSIQPKYAFARNTIIERASSITIQINQLTANARALEILFSGYYDLDASASSATSPAVA